MQNVEIRVEEVTGALVVWVFGAADTATAPQLRDTLLKLVAIRHEHVVVDLSALASADSNGLDALIAAHDATAARQRFCLAAPSSTIERLLRSTQIDTVIPVYPSLHQAIRPTHLPPRSAATGAGSHQRGIPAADFLTLPHHPTGQ